jgi:hypothetical protein
MIIKYSVPGTARNRKDRRLANDLDRLRHALQNNE